MENVEFQAGSRLDFLYPSPKNVIRLLIANLWNGLILVRDEEKSSINQQFSSNQGLMREKGSSAQSEDQKFEGSFSLWQPCADQLNPGRRQESHSATRSSFLSYSASNIHHNLFQLCRTHHTLVVLNCQLQCSPFNPPPLAL